MRTGKMRHPVKIQVPTEVASTLSGATREDFTAYPPIEVWAAIEQLTGDEGFDAQQVSAGATHKLTMRFVPKLAEQEIPERCQITFGDRVFSIKSVWNPDERNEFHVVYVSE